jgi:hypothetical protein
MRNLLLKKTVDSESKLSLIINESSTHSKNSTLIVFALVFLQEFNLTELINLYVDLIELDSVTANGLFTALILHLESLGVTAEFLT